MNTSVGARLMVIGLVGLALLAAAAGFRQPVDHGAAPPPEPLKTETDMKANGPVYSKSAYDVTPLSASAIDALASKLTPEQARVLLRKGTEPAFCGDLVDNHKEGTYCCRLCGLPLFSSVGKFDSGTGWPSFDRPFDSAHVAYERDGSLGMMRVEILCARCHGHLGHVFEDGPKPTGLRYCLNSVSMVFFEDGAELPLKPAATETAYFAGGCFWGVEDRFQQVPGVIDAVSGYMGGKTTNPTYKEVCYEDTGHAETVRVVFDPTVVSYEQLLGWFFKFHDPTQLNRQGPDHGTQYRSAIFAGTPAQLERARAFIDEQQKSNPRFALRRIVTQLEPVSEAGAFHPAEEYHQDYHAKNGGHCPLPEQ